MSLCAATAFAQTDSGSVRVLVTDSSTSAVAEARVILTNTATGVVTQRDSATAGYAVFTPVTRGTYVVEVSEQGFQKTSVNGLTVEVDERKLVTVALAVATVSETVDVTASTDVIQSEQGSLVQVIKGNIAVELPLAARCYTDLALLVPGASESTHPDPVREITGAGS